MTPAEWNQPPSNETVAAQVRAYLASRDDQISTTELVNALYPPQFANSDEGTKARKRLFGAVQRMAATELKDCASRGPVKKVMGREGRAWIWHASREPSAENSPLFVATRSLLAMVEWVLANPATGRMEPIEDTDPEAWRSFLAAHKVASELVALPDDED